jgi:hypothetical protein
MINGQPDEIKDEEKGRKSFYRSAEFIACCLISGGIVGTVWALTILHLLGVIRLPI